ITKMIQRALTPPDMSWLRKMSENTRISSQIQMKKQKNHNIDQNTWPVPNSRTVSNADMEPSFVGLRETKPGWSDRAPLGVCGNGPNLPGSRALRHYRRACRAASEAVLRAPRAAAAW